VTWMTEIQIEAIIVRVPLLCFIEGSRSRCYGRTAALKGYCATRDEDDEVFSAFPF
jgi:hypothetical protein